MSFSKNRLRQNILTSAVIFTALILFFPTVAESAQTKSAAKPAAKKTPAPKTPAPKPTAKPSTKTPDKKTADKKPADKKAADKKTTDKTAAKKDSKVKDSKTAVKSVKKDTSAKTVKSKETISKTSVKTAPAKTSDKSKTSSKASATTNTATKKPSETSASLNLNSSQAIVAATSARVRREPSISASEITRLKVGTILKVSEDNGSWYKVQIPSLNKSGWISKQVAADFDNSRREDIYKDIADRTYKSQNMSFADSVELYDFLTRSQNEVKNSAAASDFGYKRLLALRSALKAVPFGKANQKPFSDFLKKNDKSVVYSEPSGEWYVRSEEFWNLQRKYSDSPTAEDIAWAGSQNPMPGECEGYLNCYLFLLRETDGNYLNLYPNGKYSEQALKNIQNLLEPIMADLEEKKVYNGPSDVSDRAEFNRLIAELRAIISRVSFGEAEKQKTVSRLNQIAESYR